jgi:hypothetical protein
VTAIPVADLDGGEVDVVEAVEVDRDEVAAELGQVAAAEAADVAARAEVAPGDLGVARVGGERRLVAREREGVGADDRAGPPELRADGSGCRASRRDAR